MSTSNALLLNTIVSTVSTNNLYTRLPVNIALLELVSSCDVAVNYGYDIELSHTDKYTVLVVKMSNNTELQIHAQSGLFGKTLSRGHFIVDNEKYEFDASSISKIIKAMEMFINIQNC